MNKKHDAMEIIADKLRDAGCSELEINILLARFLEQEAEEYIALRQVIANSGIEDIGKMIEDDPEILDELAEEICDWLDDHNPNRKYS